MKVILDNKETVVSIADNEIGEKANEAAKELIFLAVGIIIQNYMETTKNPSPEGLTRYMSKYFNYLTTDYIKMAYDDYVEFKKDNKNKA